MDAPEPDVPVAKLDDVGNEDSNEDLQSQAFEVEDYRPTQAVADECLQRLITLRSIHPIFGVYMADQLAIADQNERILALESVLQVPGTVARPAGFPTRTSCQQVR